MPARESRRPIDDSVHSAAAIRRGPYLAARALQHAFPIANRIAAPSRHVRFATKRIADPETVSVPTRHGDVRCTVYRPAVGDQAEITARGQRPPVHIQIHGGAFIVRYPQQDDHVCRYVASEVGAVVIGVDYDTAPQVTYPVAEHQVYDVAEWVYRNGDRHGWDSTRISVGGASAGGKLAINVCQQARDSGVFQPRALTVEFGTSDSTLADDARHSAKKRPLVSRDLVRLVRATYFVDTSRRAEPLASPAFDPHLDALPPTLIMTGELDTLAAEMDRFAAQLSAAGVRVTHRRFPDVDHGFTHTKPVETAREAIGMIGTHLRGAFAPAQD